MNVKNWMKRVELIDSLESITGIREEIESDEDLGEQELENLRLLLNTKEDEVIAATPKRKATQETASQDKPILFQSDLYDRNADEDKPSYQLLMKPNMDLNTFLKEIFYKDFVKLPEPQIQIPICMAIGYLNSMAIPDTLSMPMVYIYSPEAGSGKSQLAYHWGDYYHPYYRLLFRDDTTGASLRNKLTPVANLDQPTISIIDNYHASRTKERLGIVGWASFMANNRMESNSQIVADTEGGIVSFNTHSLKVFTSITPLGNVVEQSSELKSRCIRIYANKDKQGINQFRTSYNWDGLQKEYHSVWGDPDRTNRIFKKGLVKDLLQMSPRSLPFHNREWQISVMLMSSGVYAGVWKDLNEAINHMALYWEWESGKKNNKMSPLENIITNYALEVHPRLVKDHLDNIEGTRREQRLFENLIRLADVYKYLKELSDTKGFATVNQTTSNDNAISQIFYEIGFVSDMERIKSGKIVGMYFYKQ